MPWCMSFVCLFFQQPTLRPHFEMPCVRHLSECFLKKGHGFNAVPFFLQVVFIVVFIGVLTHEMISMTSPMFFVIFQSN